jgi:hypothetical protein
MLIEGEVVEQFSKIQLGLDLHPEERKKYEDLLHKYIIFLLSATRTLKGHHGITQN